VRHQTYLLIPNICEDIYKKERCQETSVKIRKKSDTSEESEDILIDTMKEDIALKTEDEEENLDAIRKIIESTQQSLTTEDFEEIPIGAPIKKVIEPEEKIENEKSQNFEEIPIGIPAQKVVTSENKTENKEKPKNFEQIPNIAPKEKVILTQNKTENETKPFINQTTQKIKQKASEELKMGFLNSFDIFSEGTRQLYEMRCEEKRLKLHVCEMITKIINFANISIPIDPEVLKAPDFDVIKASMGCEGIMHITLSNGDETFNRISDLNAKGVLKLLNDMIPKFKQAIELELKTLGNNVNLMDKAATELKKAQPPDLTEEEGIIDIVREKLDI